MGVEWGGMTEPNALWVKGIGGMELGSDQKGPDARLMYENFMLG